MTSEALLHTTIESFYEAAWEPSKWQNAVSNYAQLTNAVGGHLLLADRPTGKVMLGIISGVPDEANQEYVGHYAALDERMPRILALPLRRPAQHEILYRDGERRRSATYNEFLKKYGDGQEQAIARLSGPAGTDLVFSSVRGSRIGAYTAAELRFAVALFPHVERAVALSRHLQAAEVQGAATMDALEITPFGAVLVAEDGRILSINRRARSIVDRADGLTAGQRRLRALRPADDRELQRLVGSAVAASSKKCVSGGGGIAVGRAEGAPSYAVVVLPMPARETLFSELRPAACIIIHDPEDTPRPIAAVVASLYGLTPAEAQAAVAVAGGHTVRDYAALAGVTENTARWRLKQVMAKTECRTQANLVRLILGGPAVLSGGTGRTP